MKARGRSGRAAVVFFVSISFLVSGTAHGEADSTVKDAGQQETVSEQAVPEAAGPSAVPQAKEPASDAGRAAETVPSIKDYIKSFPGDLVHGTTRIFYRDNLPLIAIGSGLTILALTLDGKAKKECNEDQPMGGLRTTGNTIGNGYVEVVAGTGMFLAGQIFDNRKLADTGIVTLEALLINGLATEALKYTVGRPRPNGEGDKMSFPSGHVSMTATLAASVSEMYDWDLRVAVPLYTTVAIVGVARMDSNMHYLSDVLAGAALGTLIGSSFAKSHKERAAQQKVTFAPVYEKDFKGILFSYHF